MSYDSINRWGPSNVKSIMDRRDVRWKDPKKPINDNFGINLKIPKFKHILAHLFCFSHFSKKKFYISTSLKLNNNIPPISLCLCFL